MAIDDMRRRESDQLRRALETRERPCENDDPKGFEQCPGWRIDEIDGDPSPPHSLGELFITRCDACCPYFIRDEDLELLPEAQEELRRCNKERAENSCPKCGSMRTHKCATAACWHCDDEHCEHMWLPGESDASNASHKRYSARLKNEAQGRKPTAEDFDAWMRDVYASSTAIDPDAEHDWNTLALGFLLARGVSPHGLGWEFLSSYTCGDRDRMLAALKVIK